MNKAIETPFWTERAGFRLTAPYSAIIGAALGSIIAAIITPQEAI